MDAKVLSFISLLLVALNGMRDTHARDIIVYEHYEVAAGDGWIYASCTVVVIRTALAPAPVSGGGAPLAAERQRRDASDPFATMPPHARVSFDQEMVDESGETYVNGTADDIMRMFYTFDGNCDGYIDVTEWSKLSPVDQFKMLLDASDANDDSRISLMELESNPMRLYPDNEFMMMTMDKFEEMESMTGNRQEGKGRKDAD